MIKDIFNLFVSTDKLRPAMLSPFEINGKIYATNATVLIRCDKSHCDFEITNTEKAPDCERVIPAPNMDVVLNIDRSIFDTYKTEDEWVEIECDTCDGEGQVEWEFQNYTEDFDCPVCKGDGIKSKHKTGNKIFRDVGVKLNNSYINIPLFYKLIQIRDMLEEDIHLIYQENPTNPVLFKVGFCEILLMPYMHNYDNKEVWNYL